jgi:hypothetical protein
MEQALQRAEVLLFDLFKKPFVCALLVCLKASALNFVSAESRCPGKPETSRLDVTQEGGTLCNQSSRQTHKRDHT